MSYEYIYEKTLYSKTDPSVKKHSNFFVTVIVCTETVEVEYLFILSYMYINLILFVTYIRCEIN